MVLKKSQYAFPVNFLEHYKHMLYKHIQKGLYSNAFITTN